MFRTRLKLLAIVATAVVACGSIAAGALSQGGPPEGAGLPGERAKAPAVDERVAANFALFRRDQAPADRLGDGAAARAPLGANGEHARFATTSPSGERFFLVPGDGAVCIATERAGVTTCGELDDTANDHVALESAFCGIDVPDGKYRFVLAVADGIRAVQVVEADGRVTRVPILNNVAIYEGDKSAPVPDAVRWSVRGGGSEQLDRPVPADALGPCERPNS